MPQPSREKITIIGGDEDSAPALEYDTALILYFRELPLKSFTLNVTNRTFLAERVGEDPAALAGCVLTLEVKPLRGGGNFGGKETIVVTAVRKPGQAPSQAEQAAQDAIRRKKMAEFSSLRKQELALLTELDQGQEPLTSEQVRAWSPEILDERLEQIRNNLVYLAERIALQRQHADLYNRLIALRMEAEKQGQPSQSLPAEDEMTEEEMREEIERSATFLAARAPAVAA